MFWASRAGATGRSGSVFGFVTADEVVVALQSFETRVGRWDAAQSVTATLCNRAAVRFLTSITAVARDNGPRLLASMCDFVPHSQCQHRVPNRELISDGERWAVRQRNAGRCELTRTGDSSSDGPRIVKNMTTTAPWRLGNTSQRFRPGHGLATKLHSRNYGVEMLLMKSRRRGLPVTFFLFPVLGSPARPASAFRPNRDPCN